MSFVKNAEVIKKFQKNAKDTGSTAVQIALLSNRINRLTGHFSTHSSDHASRRGLLHLVSQRRRLLKYLAETDAAGYEKLIEALGLRG